MSYLVTEIAMEMLGWKFYDTDGIARPINLGESNFSASKAKPLNKTLNIQLKNQKDLFKENPSFTVMDLTCNNKPLSLSTKKHSATSLELQNPGTNNEPKTITSASASSTNCLDFIHQATPSTIRQKSCIRKSLVSKEKTFSVNNSTVIEPVNNFSIPTTVTDINVRNTQKQFSVDFQLERILESELIKTNLDLNNLRLRFFESLNPATKASVQGVSEAMEIYRKQELKNLHKELKNMYELRQKAEHLCDTKYPKTYKKYLNFSRALRSNESLQKTNIPIFVNCNSTDTKNLTEEKSF